MMTTTIMMMMGDFKKILEIFFYNFSEILRGF